jgi:phage terminase large subunit-like protein
VGDLLLKPKEEGKKDYISFPITKIIEKEYDDYVYNIEVEEDNSYIANGVITHNCDEAGTYANLELFNSVVEPTVDLRKGKIVAIGTPQNMVDLLSQLSGNELYITKWYPIIENGKSRWKEIYDKDEIEKIKLRIGTAAFEKEYLCNPKAEVEGALYPAELIAKAIDYQLEFNTIPDEKGTRFLGVDLAIAKGPKADYDAYIVVEKVGGKTIIKHGEKHKGMSIQGKVKRIKELFDLHECESIIIDPSHVGHAVKNDLRDCGLPIYEAKMDAASRAKLLINLRRMFDAGEIVIPYNKEHALTNTFVTNMIGELLGFKETKSEATGAIIYKSTSPHDDSALSLAMACQRASIKREFLDMIGI